MTDDDGVRLDDPYWAQLAPRLLGYTIRRFERYGLTVAQALRSPQEYVVTAADAFVDRFQEMDPDRSAFQNIARLIDEAIRADLR